MNTNSNLSKASLVGLLLLIIGLALLSTRAAWRGVLFGPQANSSVGPSALGLRSAPEDRDFVLGVQPEQSGARGKDTQPYADQQDASAMDWTQPYARMRDKLSFSNASVSGYSSNPDRGLFIQQRIEGPRTVVDAVVYDQPNGTPLPAPSLTREELILLRGTLVKIGERRGDWLEIFTPAMQRGWVPAKQVAGA